MNGHPLASVIVQIYVPADKLIAGLVVWPFDQLYVYGGVPPKTNKLIEPSLPPKQLTSKVVGAPKTMTGAGWLITIFVHVDTAVPPPVT